MAGRSGRKNDDVESEINKKKIKFEEKTKDKAKPSLDPYMQVPGKWEVHEDDALGPYSVTLSQTNINANRNKFFIFQILHNIETDEYITFSRWGRVGYKGQTNIDKGCLGIRELFFTVTFKAKTGHEYKGSNVKYEKKPGKYFPIGMEVEGAKSDKNIEDENILDSKLEENVRRVMEVICSVKLINQALESLNIDLEKMPLGRLSKKQIIAGYGCLKEIEKSIDSKDETSIVEAVNNYYTNIPHFFGMKKPAVINCCEELKKEIELLDTLWNIEATINTMNLNKPKQKIIDKHPMDDFYDKMKCKLIHLDEENKMRKTIEDVLRDTKCPTHTWYKYEVKNVFEIERLTKQDKFFEKIPNKKLLWHGSRVTNWYGILSQGLRIAPKGAPVTGYMFDKGIYMADLSSKSIPFCCGAPGQKGYLALVEAALGNSRSLIDSDSSICSKLSKHENSVKGEGKMVPKNEIKLENDIMLPTGPIIDNLLYRKDQLCLQYNEYIVYHVNQVRLRYLVEIEFI